MNFLRPGHRAVSSLLRSSLSPLLTAAPTRHCSVPRSLQRCLRLSSPGPLALSSASAALLPPPPRPHGSSSPRTCSSDAVSPGSEEPDKGRNIPDTRPRESFSLDVLVSLLRQENAVDICVIQVPQHIKYTQYFLVVSGVSPRHLSAMAQYAVKVYKFLKKDQEDDVKIEGKTADDWLCIDFGTMVVHFMLPETREVYELDKLWTLRGLDEQLSRIPDEKLPEDFMMDEELLK